MIMSMNVLHVDSELQNTFWPCLEVGKMQLQIDRNQQNTRKSNTRIQRRLEWNLNSRNLKKTSTIIYLAASSIDLEKVLISIITWFIWWEVWYYSIFDCFIEGVDIYYYLA